MELRNDELMGAESRIAAIRGLVWVSQQCGDDWFKDIKLQLEKRHGPCDILRSIEGMINMDDNNVLYFFNNVLYFKSCERVYFKYSRTKMMSMCDNNMLICLIQPCHCEHTVLCIIIVHDFIYELNQRMEKHFFSSLHLLSSYYQEVNEFKSLIHNLIQIGFLGVYLMLFLTNFPNANSNVYHSSCVFSRIKSKSHTLFLSIILLVGIHEC